MYKTIWNITLDDSTGNLINDKLTYYHFGKTPKFPKQYLNTDKYTFTITILWNFKIVFTANTFVKCLTHFFIIENA